MGGERELLSSTVSISEDFGRYINFSPRVICIYVMILSPENHLSSFQSAGPQCNLYVPAPILKPKDNIVVGTECSISFSIYIWRFS